MRQQNKIDKLACDINFLPFLRNNQRKFKKMNFSELFYINFIKWWHIVDFSLLIKSLNDFHGMIIWKHAAIKDKVM